jgi:hypothetical protein
MSALGAFVAGLRGAHRRLALSALLLGVNLFMAGLLAVPLMGVLEQDLQNKDAAGQMLYGFDYAWWNAWHAQRTGWTASFQPDLFGAGFAVKNLDLLLRGDLPTGSFESPEDVKTDYPVEGPILALALAYLLVQAFLTGGVLGVLRGDAPGLSSRAFWHGAGFYFGRILRTSLLVLLVDGLVFRLNAPFARFVEAQAREAVSEKTALAWLFGRYALLLLALLFVHLVSCYAKLIVVLEDRSSALLALVSALGFCLRNLARVFGQLLLVLASAVLLIACWTLLDAGFATTGYKTQLLGFLLSQGLMFGLIALRVSLYSGQISLFRTGRLSASG